MHLLVNLFLHLQEYAFTLLPLSSDVLHLLECFTQTMAEPEQVVGHFDLLVECH